MQMLRPGLCWLHVLDVAGPLLADAYFVYIHWASANGNVWSRVRWFPRIYGYARLNTSLYTRIHRCPTRFVRKGPPCLRKYHLAEKYSLVNTRSTFIGTPRGRYFLIGHSRFYLFVHRPHSGSVLRNEWEFLLFFFCQTTIFLLHCLVSLRVDCWRKICFVFCFFFSLSPSFLCQTVAGYWGRGRVVTFPNCTKIFVLSSD